MTPREIREANAALAEEASIPECPRQRMPEYWTYDKDMLQYLCLVSPSEVIDRIKTAVYANEVYRKCGPIPIIAPEPTIDEERHRVLTIVNGLHTFPGATFCLTYEPSGGLLSNLLPRLDELVGWVTKGVFLVDLGRMEAEGMIQKRANLVKPDDEKKGFDEEPDPEEDKPEEDKNKGEHRAMFMRIKAWDLGQRRAWKADNDRYEADKAKKKAAAEQSHGTTGGFDS
ncbi:hypothetical protein BLS_003634 [Venturia inaequalis]|uniref:Uncharacterized protein n=1 Tax=Venturia inaequalis TaxID=5025 RepID=A0A8H3UT06_VENIN|nr:hypothetical protein BLS_003634 [Venturia inaequalis]KAE9975210.1 hypothetical protein EG327_008523 [Venturia inaequalis]